MKLKMKKILVASIALFTVMTITPMVSHAETKNTEILSANTVNVSNNYINPEDIVISQPGETYSTTSSKVSILGASDYRYPLYMNGQKIETTEAGYFAVYVELKNGNNLFTFTNNGKTKNVNITKKASNNSGGSGSSSSKITYWSENMQKKYAVVKGHNISRMSTPGGDGKELMMPLASGTTAQIIGETSSLYCLSDYSLVYKSNVTVKNGKLGNNVISKMDFVQENGLDCTELQFDMTQNALYNLEVNNNNAVLTIFNTYNSAWSEIPQNRLIKNIEILEDGNKGYVKYLINFQKNPPLNGYYVEFKDGKMIVGFKKLPTIKEDSLEGVRIHIDAGHGGSDTGAKGPLSTFGPLEKDINLSIALNTKEYLESKGATVIMTRSNDSAMELSKRAARVAEFKPDFSLSIHCNSMPVSANYNNAKGFLTFYSFNKNNAPEYINTFIADKVGIQKSRARYSNLAMTRMTGCPAVLFETSFMSNPEDYQWMINKKNQEAVGIAAGEAIETFIKEISKENVDSYA
ncbi:MAG: N-acetylmuramoyl-L-alanine amidase [Aminipila sp.]